MKAVTSCPACGKPLELDLPEEAGGLFAKALADTVRMVVHDECAIRRELADAESRKAEAVSKRRESWLARCPKAFQSTEVGRLPNQTATAKAMGWAYETCGGRGLVLHGSASGAGKTRTAFKLLEREHVEHGRSFSAVTHTQFSRDALELQFASDPQALRRWMLALRRAEILLIDDLGKSRTTLADGGESKAEEALCDLLDYRFSNDQPVIVTSNYAGDAMAGRFSAERGVYLMRRLREFCTPIYFGK